MLTGTFDEEHRVIDNYHHQKWRVKNNRLRYHFSVIKCHKYPAREPHDAVSPPPSATLSAGVEMHHCASTYLLRTGVYITWSICEIKDPARASVWVCNIGPRPFGAPKPLPIALRANCAHVATLKRRTYVANFKAGFDRLAGA